ncbi:MAG: hypothetical protein BAJALOKI1v1_1670002 [Promethearchaeota archaeon]|nr:MAG: hypothetical protein BAJALOKI1v1_1670002 [Candidatus Lokiarchaeota archaeon]
MCKKKPDYSIKRITKKKIYLFEGSTLTYRKIILCNSFGKFLSKN